VTEPALTLPEIVERNAKAVMAGNFAQIMADITPEAVAQMMQMAPAGGGMPLTSMPSISGYTIEEREPAGDAQVYEVRFDSPAGHATLATEWKQVVGQWKITGVRLVSWELGGKTG
jgi:hypothetical protein